MNKGIALFLPTGLDKSANVGTNAKTALFKMILNTQKYDSNHKKIIFLSSKKLLCYLWVWKFQRGKAIKLFRLIIDFLIKPPQL
ncbi:MAG: hypothetical protein GXO89_08600 [Chlorobi bacterium]|nr:hypothetical protein [Chlorobiota bacterium]